jgi:hypothetical protein
VPRRDDLEIPAVKSSLITVRVGRDISNKLMGQLMHAIFAPNGIASNLVMAEGWTWTFEAP